jgi:hypothetical protein
LLNAIFLITQKNVITNPVEIGTLKDTLLRTLGSSQML